jgi:hypothetical protein
MIEKFQGKKIFNAPIHIKNVNAEWDGIYRPPTTRSQDELAPKIQDEYENMQSQHNVQESQERIANVHQTRLVGLVDLFEHSTKSLRSSKWPMTVINYKCSWHKTY